MMKLAISVWNERISPLFDSSRRIEMFELEGQRAIFLGAIEITAEEPLAKAARLTELRVNVLICGAVSRYLAGMIVARGIKLIPFVAGDTGKVLAAFLAGTLSDQRLTMPGCNCGRMRFRGAVRGWGRRMGRKTC